MADKIQKYLSKHGPSRSSLVAEFLIASGMTAVAARQRISRVKPPVYRFPIPMLPKREAFLYLKEDRNSERFWDNFMRDLRATGSVFGIAIDGMIARGGLIKKNDFSVISSAPVIPVAKQLSVEVVAKRLISADFMQEVNHDNVAHYELPISLASTSPEGLRVRELIERVLLDAMREWARNIGLVSFDSARLRGEPNLEPISSFAFDFTGASYLLPLRGEAGKPGFVVADVFAEGRLGVNEVRYFIRKATALKSTRKDIGVLSIIVADEFSGEALTAGHADGVLMATPKDLFGKRVGDAITSLMKVLKNAAAYASSNPEQLMFLMDNLLEIEGRNGNLRGVLFELMAGYLARLDATSIDMNKMAKDPKTGKTAEIDVRKVFHKSIVTAIECKGKEPGGVLTISEVKKWLEKIPTIRAHLCNQDRFREAEHRFEIWTSGAIEAEALSLLQDEKVKRTKAPIDWKDGQAVLKLATEAKAKSAADALKQHFMNHPLDDTKRKKDNKGKAVRGQDAHTRN